MSKNERMITCISCPVGCRLLVERLDDGEISVTQNSCARGIVYGKQEFTAPVRMVTSSVRVTGGSEPLASVRTAESIPKDAIGPALREIRELTVAAPVSIGDVLLPDIAGTGVALVVSRGVAC